MRRDQAVRSGESFWWFFQRISGLALVVLLLLHFLVMHFFGDLSFQHVTSRINMPLWKVIDLSFLILALGHGLYGVWIVSGDYLHQAWMRMLVFLAVSLGGLGLLVVGLVTLLPEF
ncbi:MAG: succinate dehydrogenase, hydrophobic membrane anchor protein [Deltaproteobacteria bacterium RBG_13_61_14]|nr:MAG: succinate dehydrogenase, hydrophobic membrane anchor protein [Deltaproteobacteria bacterium RBG_13_61_14]